LIKVVKLFGHRHRAQDPLWSHDSRIKSKALVVGGAAPAVLTTLKSISTLPKEAKVAYGVLKDGQITRVAKKGNSGLTKLEDVRPSTGDCSKRTFVLSSKDASSFHGRAFNLLHLAGKDGRLARNSHELNSAFP
jgi:hypothetical protein